MPQLAHTLVVADRAAPDRLILFLHGIFGRGSNLRTVARRLVQACPRWGVVLCDLRMHGASRDFAPPHTVAAAAGDLIDLMRRLMPGLIPRLIPGLPAPVRGVLGHSLGGKVALELLGRLRGDLDHVIDVDASPSAHAPAPADSTTEAVLRLLESLPPTLPSRADLVDRAAAAGFAPPLGEWLAMNLTPADGAFALALDLTAIRQMLTDFLQTDLWPVVESLPGRARLDVVIGEKGGAFPPPDRARLARAATAQPGRLRIHVLPTGHWVHTDDPDGLVRILSAALQDGGAPAAPP